MKTALRNHQGATQVFIRHGSQDNADDKWSDRIAHFDQKIADDADRQHQIQIENIQPQRIGADDTEHADDGHEELGGNAQYFNDLLGQQNADDPHGAGSQQQNGGHFHDKSGVLEGDHGARRDPMEHERTQQHGGRRAARDAQVQQRDQGTAHTGIVGRFAGQHTLQLPLPEGLGMFGGVFGRAVGNPTGDVFADARHGTDTDADESRADDGRDVADDRAELGQNPL